MLSIDMKCLKGVCLKWKRPKMRSEYNKMSHWFDALFGERRRWKGSKDQHSNVQVGQSDQKIGHRKVPHLQKNSMRMCQSASVAHFCNFPHCGINEGPLPPLFVSLETLSRD